LLTGDRKRGEAGRGGSPLDDVRSQARRSRARRVAARPPSGHHGDMCGRFAVTTDPAVLAEKIQAINEARAAESAAPNYNVAPTTTITTVVRRHDQPDDEPTRRVRSMRWGLIPPWVKAGPDGAPESKGPLLINARADKVTTSPAFRSSAKSKRCLVPMDGYYEWRANPDPGGGKKARKTPFFLHRVDGEMLFAAGLWTVWKPAKDADPLLSCTIITTDAVGELGEIHDRMPLIVPERDWDRWLDPDAPADLGLLATPPSIHGIEMREVSTLVNNIRNNGPELLEPAEPQPEQATLL
jgi:putative SOS response-associated peptidase YedK